MEREKPFVGQTLYSLNIGNAARHCKQELTKVIVTKVGRKYFTCKDRWRETQYYLDGWGEKTDYCADSRLYITPQEWEDEKEERSICKMIGHEAFKYGNNTHHLSLDTLRQIKALIEKEMKNVRKT